VACLNLLCWGWWGGLGLYYTLKLQRLIVGWNLDYCQYRQGQGPGQVIFSIAPNYQIQVTNSKERGLRQTPETFLVRNS
jgi:hypothetical protein